MRGEHLTRLLAPDDLAGVAGAGAELPFGYRAVEEAAR
jgi:hypothetical protein